ncbi:hypothetical protein CA51_43870 [Rosistilla oblonga]|uniref:Carboxypeptidase regulatory-like domain-containing protein n=1 Tax=Rosistilla oblonga TaxID=2527990 RepID=A0A518IWF7_9BACT|nr:hypothetical protein [Rosistilla oblonga]QDV14485.1 hypothetical protein CA51_43870 [Rosistilla oblonga]QDV57385.1 hypothetical protein Mal33_33950 [Rosistilla oblonga]
MLKVRMLLWVGFAATVLGCGGGGVPVHPVTGTITVDGTPTAGIGVTLVSEGSAAMGLTGVTDDQGAFEIVAAGGYQGAPTGTYKVLLSAPRAEVDYSSNKAPVEVQFPPQYSNPNSAELTTVEVGDGDSVVTIDVKTK